MDQPKITFVWSNDGYDGMYVDGELKYQGDSLDEGVVLRVLGIEYDSVHADEEILEREGCMPDKLTDLRRRKGRLTCTCSSPSC